MKATKFLLILAIIILTSLLMFIICHAQEMNYKYAVIHHTASPDWDVERIRKIHIEENGWDDIGYHYLIRADGSVEKGRYIQTPGAHAKGRNHWIGIALTGYDEFTPEQVSALRALVRVLNLEYFGRHHAACPGPGLDVEGILQEIKLEEYEKELDKKHEQANN